MGLLTVCGWVVGAVLLVGGVIVLGHRGDVARTNPLARVSKATRAVVGLALMFAGYHVAAYVSPDGWFRLRVPLDRAWIMGVVMVAGIGLSLLMDRKQGADGGGVEDGEDGGR